MYCRNIAIVGLFTAFNVETARVIADDFGLHFLEADKYLEYSITYSIGNIIEQYGREYYLKCVRKVYRELSEFIDSVIGTSAMAITNLDNIINLRKTSYIVLLRASDSITSRRLSKERALKEIISLDEDSLIKIISNQIEPISDIIIDTSRLTPVRAAIKAQEELARMVVAKGEIKR